MEEIKFVRDSISIQERTEEYMWAFWIDPKKTKHIFHTKKLVNLAIQVVGQEYYMEITG